jgi:glycosyltransferase involved in cell wall biosynthesis
MTIHARVSAVIPARNVGRIIRPTLESLRFCDEVVVIDMFSTDDTRAVCESYPNVRFFQRRDYIYGNFNYGIDQATGDWIIRLDSDEVLSPGLQRSIQRVLADPDPPHTNYDAFSHLYLFGMRLRGLYGDQWRTVLFRKGCGRYEVRSEHEGLTLTGSTGRLDGHYDHFSTPSISAWIAKYNYYTDRDTERAAVRRPTPRWRVATDTLRFFWGAYFGKGRLYRDGYLGFAVAAIATIGQVLYHLKAWEKYERQRRSAAGLLAEHPNMYDPPADPAPGVPTDEEVG